ncbi:hypothetical protein Bhyg_03586 [Pseudolycoriella hygida]|uniref:Uncharacterized protein n=1 Tax=Pseudolycoriella hygida TaxID=35572 RepID=A0A9Q0NDZ6_9DIPT|nr:hypothetical protein Bhyg_03586 [Pseudolycoriella hygida]
MNHESPTGGIHFLYEEEILCNLIDERQH